ncbi:hypothetical protein ACN47E_006555 [Coniothyrium glycines]
MCPSSKPLSDQLSRPNLKRMATWIRDELDVLVAREGPDILKPDDVLMLHETFIALRQAETISLTDLRATGIHRAVRDIAGVATRWPGRLCDDCDEIISVWTVKFGPVHDLHPFLYGRGGRLEGIATPAECSREALLKRWAETCPEKIHPNRSHRHGDLGFKAGAWWINPLFAHHAGIIGIESCEGGTTYDKHGAYAVVLKDSGEIEATSEARFTYRVPQNDRGKFRLTAATPKSRDPIRVLRSHSINSVWGPKAGIRYDGLYRVLGWSIKQAKTADTAGGRWKEGDILFDVKFQRSDPGPVEDITKHPTATEVDDYTEYKRLRKVHREDKREHWNMDSATRAPPLIKSLSPESAMPNILLEKSPVTPHASLFHTPQFQDRTVVHSLIQQDVVSPMTIPDMANTPFLPAKSSTLALPERSNIRPLLIKRSDTVFSDADEYKSSSGSLNSSAHTAIHRAPLDIKEVAPWTDLDAPSPLSSPANIPVISRYSIVSLENPAGRGRTDRTEASESIANDDACDSPSPPAARHGRRRGSELKTVSTYLKTLGSKQDIRKSTFKRNRNPMGKLLDGVEEVSDYFGATSRRDWTLSLELEPAAPDFPLGKRPSSSEGTMSICTPIPTRMFSPDSPLSMRRRNEICEPNDIDTVPLVPTIPTVHLISDGDSYIHPSVSYLPTSRSSSSDRLLSPSRAAAAIQSHPKTPVQEVSLHQQHDSSSIPGPNRLQKTTHHLEEPAEVKTEFKNPFDPSPKVETRVRTRSEHVPPHMIA